MVRNRAYLAPAAALAALVAMLARAEAIETGQVLPDATLAKADGGSAPLVERASSATVVVFFRGEQERSEETLRMLAACGPRLAGKPVRLVGVVPVDSAAAAQAAVTAARLKLPVLVDQGDAVYSAARLKLHPAIAIVDRSRRVLAFEPYREVGSCDLLVAHVRRALGEVSDTDVARVAEPAKSSMPGDDPTGVAQRHVKFGRKLLQTKAYAAAHENARKALAIAPVADAWRLEAEVFAAEGRCAEATKAFDSAVALEPKGAAARPACGR